MTRATLGRPRQIDRPAIVAATLRPPADGSVSTRWSCRELGANLGVSEASVARVWREYGLTPRPGGAFEFTVQPPLKAERVDVIGVCVTRRVRAIALVVDDGALGALNAVGPARPRIALARWATSTSPSGPAPEPCPVASVADPDPPAVARKVGVRDFLRRLTEVSAGRAVHVVVDSAHLQRLMLQSVPQLTSAGIAVHFALDTEKWLNLVDVWCGLLERDGEGSDHPAFGVRELIAHDRTMVWTPSLEDDARTG